MGELKAQLRKAQDRMKRFADSKRSERQFAVGDWVYLKLQPYRQVTVKGKENKKLSPKFYGPFEILSRIGKVAYELNLPAGSQIHPVFHVSQLKKRIGNERAVSPGAPLQYPLKSAKEIPEGILGRRMVKRKNVAIPQILIKWKNQGEENCSWEDYDVIKEKYPEFILEDKEYLEGRRVSEDIQSRLVTVGNIDLVNDEEKRGAEEGQLGQATESRDQRLRDGTGQSVRKIKIKGQRSRVKMTMGPRSSSVSKKNGMEEPLTNKGIRGS